MDPAPQNQKTKNEGGLALGLAVTALVAAIFFTLLFLPGVTGSGRSELPDSTTPAAEDANVFEAAFGGHGPTRTYLATLEETFPSAAETLRTDIKDALTRGAGQDELALLALRAGGEEIWTNLGHLSHADTAHFDNLIAQFRSGLENLSASNAGYCMGDDLLAYASLPKQELYRAVLERARYASPLYEFAVSTNTLLLKALADGRSNPVIHSRLAGPDQTSLRDLGLAVMTNTRLAQLLTSEGKTRTEMDQVFSGTDFCQFGIRILDRTDALPEVTKGRLWATAIRLIESGAWRWYLYQLQAT